MKSLVLSALLAGGIGCGTISNQPPPQMPGPPVATPMADGEWAWRHEQTGDDGVKRVEVEHWHLRTRGSDVAGYYDRVVTLRALDGVPFRCNQGLEYELRTRYRVGGNQRGDRLTLRELDHRTVPSPCETDERRRASYTGRLAEGTLRLEYDGGSQVLERVGEAREPAPLPRVDRTVAGTWHWSRAGHTRREQERWLLEERAAGVVVGSYERTVTEGDCAIVARYRVRGIKRGDHVQIAETEVEVDPAECERHEGQRHLDSARGTAFGDTLVLEWRGGRRQVLSRQ